MDELKEKIARAACSQELWPGAFDRETEGNQENWRDIAQAALTAIEEAGFVLTPKSDWSKGLEGLPTLVGSRPTSYRDDPRSARQIIEEDNWPGHYSGDEQSYATLADSATSFDPEKQFEKDREEGR